MLLTVRRAISATDAIPGADDDHGAEHKRMLTKK
jgi:hypothetical protein